MLDSLVLSGEATCYGLRALNYMMTSNHIHLLVMDDGKSSISKNL